MHVSNLSRGASFILHANVANNDSYNVAEWERLVIERRRFKINFMFNCRNTTFSIKTKPGETNKNQISKFNLRS